MVYPEAQRLVTEMVEQGFIRVAPVTTGEGRSISWCLDQETCG